MGAAGVLVIADVWGAMTAVATTLLLLGVVLAWLQGRQAAVAAKKTLDAMVKQVEVTRKQARAIQQQVAQARKQATAAQGQVAAAQKQAEAAYAQIEASYRPLLADISEHASGPSDLDPDRYVTLDFGIGKPVEEVDWRRAYVDLSEENIRVAVPLRNVGTGLAVIERDGGELNDGHDDRSMLLADEQARLQIHRERVAPGETARVLCTGKMQDRELDSTSLELVIHYKDFRGGQAATARVLLEHAHEPAAEGAQDKDNKPHYWHVREIRYVDNAQTT